MADFDLEPTETVEETLEGIETIPNGIEVIPNGIETINGIEAIPEGAPTEHEIAYIEQQPPSPAQETPKPQPSLTGNHGDTSLTGSNQDNIRLTGGQNTDGIAGAGPDHGKGGARKGGKAEDSRRAASNYALAVYNAAENISKSLARPQREKLQKEREKLQQMQSNHGDLIYRQQLLEAIQNTRGELDHAMERRDAITEKMEDIKDHFRDIGGTLKTSMAEIVKLEHQIQEAEEAAAEIRAEIKAEFDKAEQEYFVWEKESGYIPTHAEMRQQTMGLDSNAPSEDFVASMPEKIKQLVARDESGNYYTFQKDILLDGKDSEDNSTFVAITDEELIKQFDAEREAGAEFISKERLEALNNKLIEQTIASHQTTDALYDELFKKFDEMQDQQDLSVQLSALRSELRELDNQIDSLNVHLEDLLKEAESKGIDVPNSDSELAQQIARTRAEIEESNTAIQKQTFIVENQQRIVDYLESPEFKEHLRENITALAENGEFDPEQEISSNNPIVMPYENTIAHINGLSPKFAAGMILKMQEKGITITDITPEVLEAISEVKAQMDTQLAVTEGHTTTRSFASGTDKKQEPSKLAKDYAAAKGEPHKEPALQNGIEQKPADPGAHTGIQAGA